MRRIATWFLVVVLVASACADDDASPEDAITTSTTTRASATSTITSTSAPTSTTTPTTTTVPPATAVTHEMVANAIVSIDGESVTLVDGRGDGPPFVRVVGSAISDVTGDGVDDAAVVLAHDYPGTTGRFSSLALFHFPADEIVHTEPIVYVDRGRTLDLWIEDSMVRLRWSERMFWDRGEQTIHTYSFDGSALTSTDTRVSALVEGTDLGFRFDITVGLDFGSSVVDARSALVAVLGEPSDEGMTATCWGRHDHLLWDSSDGTISVGFLEDEFYNWWASDPRLVAGEVVVGGASLAWLEQWFQTEFTTIYSEIGGNYVRELDALVTLDETGTMVSTVGGSWTEGWERLHTVILDPAENPDLWCGD